MTLKIIRNLQNWFWIIKYRKIFDNSFFRNFLELEFFGIFGNFFRIFWEFLRKQKFETNVEWMENDFL